MKKSIRYAHLFMVLAALLVLTPGCKEDEPEPDRDKFLGAFSVVETCGSGNDSYDLTVIESGSGENAVIVINLYNVGAQISGTVSGNSMTIANQLVNGITYSGTGTISENTLTINFSVSGTVQGQTLTDNCNSVCTRR